MDTIVFSIWGVLRLAHGHCFVPIGEDPAAHGHWCAFTDLYHTIPYGKFTYPSQTSTIPYTVCNSVQFSSYSKFSSSSSCSPTFLGVSMHLG